MEQCYVNRKGSWPTEILLYQNPKITFGTHNVVAWGPIHKKILRQT